MTINDPLWNDFRSLWSDLPLADDKILVAGGYGLLLKQRWILDTRNQPIVTPIENWRDGSPRVTKDIDIVVGLELLASIKVQEKMVAALGKNQFKVVEDNPRWQF